MARFQEQQDSNDNYYSTGGTYGSAQKSKWFICDICGLSWPEGRIRRFRGLDYGIPCKCSKDIDSILRDENLRKVRTERDEDWTA